jgi:hypothetical protein
MKMEFEDALSLLKQGYRVARQGWNGKGMFLFMVSGSTFTVNKDPWFESFGEGTEINYHPHIDMKMADGSVMVWSPSQVDIFGTDWEVVNDEV